MPGEDRRRIGVLGGMGPDATVHFMARVIAMTQALDDADHIPMLVDNNPQVPSRIAALIEKDGEDPGPTLAAMAKALESQHCDALVMPCNTAHNYSSQVAGAVAIPFLNMIDLAIEHITSSTEAKTVGILASPAIKLTGIYERGLRRAGISSQYPDDDNVMLGAIRALKRDVRDRSARATLASAANELSRQGADVLLLACSEFSAISDVIHQSAQTVDSIDVLARATIAFSIGVPLATDLEKR